MLKCFHVYIITLAFHEFCRYLTFFEKRLSPGGGYNGNGRMQLMQTAAVSPFAIVMFCNAGDVEVRNSPNR